MLERTRGRPDGPLGYLVVAGFAFASYAVNFGPYLSFTNHVLPSGDPFSYTVGWFRGLDIAHQDYFGTLLTLPNSDDWDWNRLLNILTLVLSPLLTKEPASLCAVNYVMWGLGAAAFFHLGRRLGLGVGRAFIVALIPWVWPINYGFADKASIPVMAVDAAFTGALHVALAMSIVFALDPRRTLSAILAGLSIGVAIWGRGNSVFVVALVVFWPCVTAFAAAIRQRDRRIWINFALVALIGGGMAAEFYFTYWDGLAEYYGNHVNVVQRHAWSLDDALPYIKYIPGYMMWRSPGGNWPVVLSCVSDLAPMMVLLALWRKAGPCRSLAAAGAFIYYVGYAANLLLWNDPNYFSPENTLPVWRPLLVGMSLSLIGAFIAATDRFPKMELVWLAPPTFVAALAWGMVWTRVLTPSGEGGPKPSTVERFSANLDGLLEGKGELSFLWYENWNMPLIIYYRLKDDLTDMDGYVGPHNSNVWSITDVSGVSTAQIVEGIVAGVREAFDEAGAVVIPEFTDDYQSNEPYAFSRYRDDWSYWVNTPEAPKMRVRMILQESPTTRLLVLQREDAAQGRGDPFRLPWGKRPATPGPDYSSAVMRFD